MSQEITPIDLLNLTTTPTDLPDEGFLSIYFKSDVLTKLDYQGNESQIGNDNDYLLLTGGTMSGDIDFGVPGETTGDSINFYHRTQNLPLLNLSYEGITIIDYYDEYKTIINSREISLRKDISGSYETSISLYPSYLILGNPNGNLDFDVDFQMYNQNGSEMFSIDGSTGNINVNGNNLILATNNIIVADSSSGINITSATEVKNTVGNGSSFLNNDSFNLEFANGTVYFTENEFSIGKDGFRGVIEFPLLTDERVWLFPDIGGTIALNENLIMEFFTPSNSGDLAKEIGTICYDHNYLYWKHSNNAWRRVNWDSW